MSKRRVKFLFLIILLASIVVSAHLVPGPRPGPSDPPPSSPDPRPAPYPDPRPAPYPDPSPSPWPDPSPSPWPDPSPSPWPDPSPSPWPDPSPSPWPDPSPAPYPDPTPIPTPPPVTQVRTLIVNELVQNATLDLIYSFRLQKPELQGLAVDKLTGTFDKYDSSRNVVELIVDGQTVAKAKLKNDPEFSLTPKNELVIGRNYKSIELKIDGKIFLKEISLHLK